MASTFSVRDLCQRYAVTEYTLLSWIRSRELRAINVGRSLKAKKPRWRVTPEALDAFDADCTTAQDSQQETTDRRYQVH
jgi:hypothetical protein